MLKNKIKILALVMSLTFAGSVFAGCGSSSTGSSGKSDQVIKININADPKTIDPGLNSSVEGAQVICNAFEGLTNLDKENKPIPGVAEKWEVSSDSLTYTFHLRKDAKWSDGKPVTAKDFEYAWKRALDPKTVSEYAYQLYYLKNGEAFNKSTDPKATKKASIDEVGVKATDDYTLVATLEGPTPYFLSLTAFPTYAPVRKDVVEKNPKDWATKAETYISNGPFSMKEYKPKDSLNFVKNTNYWNAKNIKLDKIEFKTLENNSSYLSAFRTGQLDVIEKPPAQEIPKLLEEGTAKAYPYLGTYYYNLNVSPAAEKVSAEAAKALKDVRVRKALNFAIDRTALVEKVTKAGEKPATSFVPSSVQDSSGKAFKNKEYYKATTDIDQAKKLLAEAGYPDGKGFPKMELLYNTDQGHQNIAQAIQDMWKKNLGIDIQLRNVERKVHLTELNKRNYTLARDGWIADYNDPMTFLDMFTSNNEQNHPGYANPEFDKLITAARVESDVAKRLNYLHQAEDLLMNDMPFIPIYEYTNIVCINKKVKNIYMSPLGFIICRDAYIEK